MQNTFRSMAALAALCCLSLSAAIAQGNQPGPLRVGIATADITPEAPVAQPGFAGRQGASSGVARPLLAQCVLFDNGQTRLALIAMDLLNLSYNQLLGLRAAAEREGIPQQHLMVNVSHTHFGAAFGGDRNPEYDALFAERARALFGRAAADLQPALLDFTIGSCTMGMNRRQLNDQGRSVRINPEPRKQIDPDVPVLRVLDPEGRARAVLFGYACHPTTAALRMMNLVGTDYPGYARDWVAAAYPGAEAIFFQGCGGDIKTRAIRPANGRATGQFHLVLLDERESKAAVGYELGRAVVAATAVTPTPVPADRPADPRQALNTPVPLGGIVETVALPSKADPAVMGRTLHHQGMWRIGDVFIWGGQGEMLSNIGLHVKEKLPGLRLWTCGYTHYGGGYFADAASYPEGGYEVQNSAFGPQAEGIVVENAVRYVRELQANPVHARPIPRVSG
ncbi:MAG: hypothetical protein HY321_07045 [Armatimonadetes bacterium]|nr:hypothetical protein [Armatimonadota bacterium]